MPLKFTAIVFNLIAICFSLNAQTQDSLLVIFNQYQYLPGENITIETAIENFDKEKVVPKTLHLWIDNIKTGKRQKFRYPIIDGYIKFVLTVDKSIPEGKYAFNFLLDKQFFSIDGKINKGLPEDKKINYMVTAKKKAPVINDVAINPDNSFAIKNFYFLDTVLFSFSPAANSKENNLKISISTPLDSAFTPSAMVTEFIQIGGPTQIGGNDNAAERYSFIPFIKDKNTLNEIVVRGRKKTEGELFDEENSRGVFTMGDPTVLDLLSSEEYKGYTDLFTYIQTKFPGIQQSINIETGRPFLRWRNETVDIYVDEVYMEGFDVNDISIQDIAIVKVYRQGYRLQGGNLGDGLGGTIAIYTKARNRYDSNKLSNYIFYIKGYNNLFTEWKNN